MSTVDRRQLFALFRHRRKNMSIFYVLHFSHSGGGTHKKSVTFFSDIFKRTHSRAIKKLFKQQRAFFLGLQTCNVYVDIAHTNSHRKLQHNSLNTLSGAAAARPCLSERREAKNKWNFHYWSRSFSYQMKWMMFYFLCSKKSQAKLNDNSSELSCGFTCYSYFWTNKKMQPHRIS